MRRKDGQIFYSMYVHITTCSASVFLCFVAFIIIGVEWMDGILEFLLTLEGKGMGMDFPWGGGVCVGRIRYLSSHRYCKLSRVN